MKDQQCRPKCNLTQKNDHNTIEKTKKAGFKARINSLCGLIGAVVGGAILYQILHKKRA